MSRKRYGTVRESKEYLDALADLYGDQVIAPRIEMLRVLRTDPAVPAWQLAEYIDVSDRTIRRWWHEYCDGGLRKLLESDVNTLDVPSNVSLRSRSGRVSYASSDVSTRFARFLNTIPTTYDVEEWVLTFRDGLMRVLDGVDHATVVVDVGSGLDGGESPEMEVAVMKGASRAGARQARASTRSVRGRSPGRVLYEQARADGFPVDKYYPPSIFDFYTDGTEFVGTILLWSRKGKPIPRATVDFIESLRGFITYVMNDCVVRQSRKDPELRYFKDILLAIAYRIGLTPRELEVFLLQMTGVERDEIAEMLGIAHGTATKHMCSIYAKAGTRNLAELLARFIVPLRDD